MPPRARPTRGRKAAAAATPDDPAPEVAPPAEQELKPEPLSDTVAPEATLTETPAEVPVPEPEVEAPATAPAPPPLFAPTAADFDNSDDEPLPDSPPLDKPKPAWQAALPAPIAPMMRGRSASKSPKKSSKRTPGASQSPTKKRSTKSGSKSSSEAPGITPIANMAPPPRPRSRADQPAEESEVSDDDHDAYSGYDTDDDPVIRTYDVFTTSELAENLYVFQYPVRSAQKPYRKQENCCPIEARLKPKCKVVEIDVPVNVHLNYDEQKGRNWGEVLRKAKQAEGGIAGKATVGAKGGKRRKVKEDDEEEEEPDINYMDFEDAVKKKRILAKQTLGSKMHPDQPKYMLGVFKDDALHLTPVQSTLQLRPQFPHVDAQLAQERAASKAANASEQPDKPVEAKAVHMTVKNADDPNQQQASVMKTLRDEESEAWTTLHWMDQDEDECWNMFDRLKLNDMENAEMLMPETSKQEYMDWISGRMKHGPQGDRK